MIGFLITNTFSFCLAWVSTRKTVSARRLWDPATTLSPPPRLATEMSTRMTTSQYLSKLPFTPTVIQICFYAETFATPDCPPRTTAGPATSAETCTTGRPSRSPCRPHRTSCRSSPAPSLPHSPRLGLPHKRPNPARKRTNQPRRYSFLAVVHHHVMYLSRLPAKSRQSWSGAVWPAQWKTS